MSTVAGIDRSRIKYINGYLQDCIAKKKLSCASIAVYRKNILVHESYHGFQDIGKKIALTKNSDTIFRIYSMTKPIVSIALMQLYEKGKFKLTDPVKLYIPNFDKRKLPGIYDYEKNKHLSKNDLKLENISTKPIKSQIRIWQLLTHTSGLTYGFDTFGLLSPVDKLYNDNGCVLSQTRDQKDSDITLEEFIDNKLTKMPLTFEPGEKWNYSLSTDVCGRLIEVISGIKLDKYLYEYIFKPLEMNDTAFYVSNSKLNRFAKLYMSSNAQPTLGPRDENAPKRKEGLIDISSMVEHNYSKGHKYLSGGGGLTSTLNDYSKFTLMLLNNGKGMNGNQIISRKTLQFMTMNHLKNNSDLRSLSVAGYNEITQKGIGFGLGFSVVLNPNTKGASGMRCSDGSAQISSIGSFSWGGAAETFFWVDPKEDLCVVFMTQLLYNNRLKFDIRSTIQTLIYGSIVDDDKLKSKL